MPINTRELSGSRFWFTLKRDSSPLAAWQDKAGRVKRQGDYKRCRPIREACRRPLLWHTALFPYSVLSAFNRGGTHAISSVAKPSSTSCLAALFSTSGGAHQAGKKIPLFWGGSQQIINNTLGLTEIALALMSITVVARTKKGRAGHDGLLFIHSL